MPALPPGSRSSGDPASSPGSSGMLIEVERLVDGCRFTMRLPLAS